MEKLGGLLYVVSGSIATILALAFAPPKELIDFVTYVSLLGLSLLFSVMTSTRVRYLGLVVICLLNISVLGFALFTTQLQLAAGMGFVSVLAIMIAYSIVATFLWRISRFIQNMLD